MYCLVIFYQATSEETAPLRPLPQMLCVKFAIFGSFFQQIIISLLVNLIYTCINKNTTDQTMASAAPPECLLSKSEMASEIHVSTIPCMYVCVNVCMCAYVWVRLYVCICMHRRQELYINWLCYSFSSSIFHIQFSIHIASACSLRTLYTKYFVPSKEMQFVGMFNFSYV